MRQKLTDLSVRKLEKPQTQTRPVEPGNYTFLNATNAPEKCYLQIFDEHSFNLEYILTSSAQISFGKIWFFRGRKSGKSGKFAVLAAQGFRTNLLQHRVLPRLRHRHPCHAWQIDGHDGIWISQFKGRHLTKATGSK